jgi:hypothetical protein
MQNLIRHPYNWYTMCRWWRYCDPLHYCNLVSYCTLFSHIAVMIGCLVTDVKDVSELAPLLFVPQLLFAGDFFACIVSPVTCERTLSLYPICYSRYHLTLAWRGTDEQDDIFLLLLPSFHCWMTINFFSFYKGFFIRTSLIPVFLRWAQYLCAIKYAINLVLLTEFNVLNKSCQGAAAMNCKNVLKNNDIKVEDTYIYILVIFALFLVFRIIGAAILIKKARRFY